MKNEFKTPHKLNDIYYIYKYLIVICGGLAHIFYTFIDYILGVNAWQERLLCFSISVVALSLVKIKKYQFIGVYIAFVAFFLFLLDSRFGLVSSNSGYILSMMFIVLLPLKLIKFLIIYITAIGFFCLYQFLAIQNNIENVIVDSATSVGSLFTALIIYVSINSYRKQLNKFDLYLKERNHFLENTYNQLVHDVKSPLTALKFISTKEQSDNLLKSATERVEKIILDLEENNNSINVATKFDIKSCIEDVIDEAKIKYKDILHEVDIICNFDLKSERVELLNLDKIVFSRIISNLINNAFEAKDSPEHIIKLSTFIFEDKLKIKISDNGVGITNDKLKKITKSGYSTKGNNRGYGLSHAKSKVEKANGKINFNNDSGFVILISLPLKQS